MKTTRLNRAENISADEFPTTTPEQDAEDWEAVFDELVEISRKLPPNQFPAQTMKEIFEDFRKPMKTIVTRADGQQVMVCDGVVTILAEKADAPEITEPEITEPEITGVTFTDDELAILEQLKNAES